MSSLGFKELSEDNWLEPDKLGMYFVKLSASGEPISIAGNERLIQILQPKLNEKVPIEVKKLFEVARGIMVYAYYFYPLYMVGAEQLFRVMDCAVHHKCLEIGKVKNRFADNLKILFDNNIIPDNKKVIWDAIRHLRNIASHPKDQAIVFPSMAIGEIYNCCNEINNLFN